MGLMVVLQGCPLLRQLFIHIHLLRLRLLGNAARDGYTYIVDEGPLFSFLRQGRVIAVTV